MKEKQRRKILSNFSLFLSVSTSLFFAISVLFSACFAQANKTSQQVEINDPAAARFLQQAALGYNLQMIDDLQQIGFSTWLQEQRTKAPSLLQPYMDYLSGRLEKDAKTGRRDVEYHATVANTRNVGNKNQSTAWLRAVFRNDDYLRQKIAWILSQILVVSNTSNARSTATTNYYDLLVSNAFSNYEELLLKVTMHPMMGHYLSYLGNRQADPSNNIYPDENYAREVMQLFTIGLWELNDDGTRKLDDEGLPIPTYNNQDIVTLASVFTGFELDKNSIRGKGKWARYVFPMVLNPTHHDNKKRSALGGKIDISAGQSAEANIEQAIKALVAHPNTAPFVSKRLIQHLVTSNPSEDFVSRVVKVWRDSNGNLGRVVQAILMDVEARDDKIAGQTMYGRLKDPVSRVVQFARAFSCGVNEGNSYDDYPGLQWWNPSPEKLLGQEPMRAPSVFNFFDATYINPGEIAESGMRSPEFQLLDDVSAVRLPNYLWLGIVDGFHKSRKTGKSSMQCDFSVFNAGGEMSARDIVETSNLLLAAGSLKKDTVESILSAVEPIKDFSMLSKQIVYGVAISAESAVQK